MPHFTNQNLLLKTLIPISLMENLVNFKYLVFSTATSYVFLHDLKTSNMGGLQCTLSHDIKHSKTLSKLPKLQYEKICTHKKIASLRNIIAIVGNSKVYQMLLYYHNSYHIQMINQ